MFRCFFHLLTAGFISFVALQAIAQETPSGLLSGLVATASDGEREVLFVTPTPNFTLNERQSIHPQLKPEFRLQWNGFLNLVRAGKYTFSGAPKIFINSEEVQGRATEFPTGELPLRIAFERKDGEPARLQLQWQSEFFELEPVPAAVLGHRQPPAALARHAARDRGRDLVEELNCAACHTSGSLLNGRPGPDLSGIGSRTSADWIFHWLGNPQHFRAGTPMPATLITSQERADVAAFLSRLKDAESETGQAVPVPEQIEKGRKLFNGIGCAACHDPDQSPLRWLGSKYEIPSLARFLMNPLSVDPSGRMPHMNLTWDEAEPIAAHLVQSRNPEFETKAPAGDPARGREIVSTSGCVNCHSITERGRKIESRLSAAPFVQLKPGRGCLADTPSGFAPHYAWADEDRQSVEAFLERPDRSEAPVQDFHRMIKQFNCAACHDRNGPATFVFEDHQAPPPLTDAGNKLRASWLAEVLLREKRIRPWMNLRMPHYGREQMAPLVDLFAAQAGAELGEGKTVPPPTPPQLAQGVQLLGRGEGLACINCHDYAGHKSLGDLRGPDLVEMDARIRADWMRRWLLEPSRIQPGTAMPAFFSQMPREQADSMIEPLIHALAAREKLPQPAGFVEVAQGYVLSPKHEAILLRTFIPGSSHRSIAVGLPGGQSYVFDALTSRFRYAWAGGFLDAQPAWGGRGGAPAVILGEKYYTAPDTFPIRIGDPAREPKVQFRGYELAEEKTPRFFYDVDGVAVSELITAAREGDGLVRSFELGPVKQDVWFLAGESESVSIHSNAGEIANGRLRIPAAETIRFEVTIRPR
jgi:mono/diheme cytochrome c family protein